MAVIVRGQPTKHLIHAILTLLTLGVWAIVWIIVGIGGGERRRTITVSDSGQVAVTEPTRG